MSQDALLLAVRNHLRSALSLTDAECEVQIDGMPPPVCGERFVSVHEGDWRNDNGDYDLTEIFGVEITVTRKVGYCPVDRIGTEVLTKAQTGLNALCRSIMVAIHHNQEDIRVAANTLMEATDYAFFTTLTWTKNAKIQVVGHEWFGAEPPDSSGREWTGIARTLYFDGAGRGHPISGMS